MTVAIAAVFLFSPHLASSSEEKIEYKDTQGRKMFLPADPKRVIGLSASIIEIVYDLGKGDILIGAVSYSDFPEQARSLPRVGSYSKPDLEKIVSLKPDLCIAMKDGNPEDSVKRIESFGIPVFVVDTSGLDGIYQAISALGIILNAESAADKITKSTKNRISLVQEKINKAGISPGVVFEVNEEPLILAGTGTFIDEMIKLAGGRNLISGGVDYPRLSREKAVSAMPDIIIISGMVEEKRTSTWWQKFSYVPAVKNRRIHHVSPDVFLRPTPRIAGCIEELAKIIHPELFK